MCCLILSTAIFSCIQVRTISLLDLWFNMKWCAYVAHVDYAQPHAIFLKMLSSAIVVVDIWTDYVRTKAVASLPSCL